MSPRLTPTTQKDKTDPEIILPIIEVIKPPPSSTLSTVVVSSPPFAVEILVRSKRPPEMVESRLPYEVLDLAIDGISSSELCRDTMKLFASAKRIIVVAGAGISVAAGIPDFRSSTGLFSTFKADTKFKPSGKALFDASVYKVHSLDAGNGY
jgi:NAD-dependent histone deacetylase SIR2